MAEIDRSRLKRLALTGLDPGSHGPFDLVRLVRFPWCSVGERPCSSASRGSANAATCRSSRTSATAPPSVRRWSPISATRTNWRLRRARLAHRLGSQAHRPGALLINALDEDAEGARQW